MPPLRCVLAAASERVEPGSTGRSTITSVVNGTQDVDFTSLVVTPRALAFTSILGDPAEEWATPAVGFGLAPGVYTLTLTGTNSASMGSDAGNLALTPGLPAAVPSPTTTPCCLPVSGSSAFSRAAAPDRRRLDIEAGPVRCSWADDAALADVGLRQQHRLRRSPSGVDRFHRSRPAPTASAAELADRDDRGETG